MLPGVPREASVTVIRRSFEAFDMERWVADRDEDVPARSPALPHRTTWGQPSTTLRKGPGP